MKKFDLEKALAGEAVVTRDGRDVTQLTKFDCSANHDPIWGVIEGELMSFSIEGNYLRYPSSYDLFMAESERWVNVYWDEEQGLHNGKIYPSQAAAKEYLDGHITYQTTIKLK
jgi:hypothetical protein